jgi:outer membrane protein assembly factor BamC
MTFSGDSALKPNTRLMPFAALCAAAALASGCSVLESDRIDYKSAGRGPTLEVPPDLTKLPQTSRFAVPGESVSAASLQLSTQLATAPTAQRTAPAALGDVRIERQGNQRWLVVNRTPDQLWSPIRDFWQESGFLLTQDDPQVGIMETDWAENRAKLPQDIIRNTIGRLLEGLYSTGERDRFRTRLERNGNATEIFVTHRGMVEVYSNQAKDQTVWQPRAADAELEAEFLRRLMVKLGVPQDQSRAVLAAAPAVRPAAAAGGAAVSANQAIAVDEPFDRAWRRVGLALDRAGFTVEDRDRSRGTYFVRYVDPAVVNTQPGLLQRIMGSTPSNAATLRFRVVVQARGENSTVTVLGGDGQPDNGPNAQRIASVLAADLR